MQFHVSRNTRADDALANPWTGFRSKSLLMPLRPLRFTVTIASATPWAPCWYRLVAPHAVLPLWFYGFGHVPCSCPQGPAVPELSAELADTGCPTPAKDPCGSQRKAEGSLHASEQHPGSLRLRVQLLLWKSACCLLQFFPSPFLFYELSVYKI